MLTNSPVLQRRACLIGIGVMTTASGLTKGVGMLNGFEGYRHIRGSLTNSIAWKMSQLKKQSTAMSALKLSRAGIVRSKDTIH